MSMILSIYVPIFFRQILVSPTKKVRYTVDKVMDTLQPGVLDVLCREADTD